MLTLPADDGARRVPFDTHAVPVHSSQDVLTPDSRPPTKAELKKFQEKYSSLKSIRLCGINRHRCRSALCARCSGKRVRRHRRELMVALRTAEPAYALLWTSTIASTPNRPLGELWDELDRLQVYMVSGSWLSRRVDGYVRVVEIECFLGGWHPHTHTLLVFTNKLSREDALKLAREIQARYLRAAGLRGIAASAKGQHVQVVPLSQLSTVVDYITKSHMLTGPSRTPGTITPSMLLRASYAGDTDALDLLVELERASYRRRTWQSGGTLRLGPTANAPAPPACE